MTETWRDKQAARPDPITLALDAWDANPEASARDRMGLALFAAQMAEEAAKECDEPGCYSEASCGFSVDGGYRRTCYEHSEWAKP